MANKKAEEYLRIYDVEWGKNATFRSLWQDTSSLQFPRESNINETNYRGSEQTEDIPDTTAIEDSKEMADGLSSAIIPAGEYFFKLNVPSDNLGGQSEDYVDYLHYLTDRTHTALFDSNFLLQLAESLRSLVVFGTCCLYSEWSGGLNFKDYDIALYQILENSKGQIDTIMIKFPFTPRQAAQEWGEENIGKSMQEALKDEKKQNDNFQILHFVEPRKGYNPRFEDSLGMQWESTYIAVKDKEIIDEGGYPDFPYHVARWMKTTGEVNGRGIGTQINPQVRVLNQQLSDWIEFGNKAVNPAREVLSTFEGELRTFPGATNEVVEIPSTKIMEMGAQNAPIGEKEILMQREVVHKAYKRDVWVQLADLKGDRRTTVEIRQRVLEGLRRIGQPAYRIQSELLGPNIRRNIKLLIENGAVEPPPPGLSFPDIEYLGLMANALTSGKARATQQWMAIGSELSERFPALLDNVNADQSYRDIGRSLGVGLEHMNTIDQRDGIRETRQKELQQKEAMEQGQALAQGYSQTTGAPEEGSPAGAVMEAAGG